MREKKPSGRKSLALSILCVALLAGLVVAVIAYARLDSAYNDKISEFNTYAANHSHNNTEYDVFSEANSLLQAYKMTHTHVDADYDSLTATVNLEREAYWRLNQTISQPPSSYTNWTVTASYAGYVSVDVQSSTNNTYVQLIWSSHGISFDQKIVVGTNGTASFPILPASNIDIRIGNSNVFDEATENVTATYYY
jgi:hypothetical protein